jgi:nitrite reductase (NADH) small subunit/3-phenylpropionate/trans-cinnamate dioxygenase ferredoxin subunit
MPRFITVAKAGDIPAGKGRFVVVEDQRIALFFVDGQYYALDDYCPHMGAPLWTGDIHQGLVICDRHMWAFDLKTGRCPDAPSLTAKTFPVRVVGEEIQVALPDFSPPA